MIQEVAALKTKLETTQGRKSQSQDRRGRGNNNNNNDNRRRSRGRPYYRQNYYQGHTASIDSRRAVSAKNPVVSISLTENQDGHFKIDTGSNLSILPVFYFRNRNPVEMFLYAANNSKIATYGEKRFELDLGVSRNFSWNNCIAAVPRSIIGADLLSHYGLVVDLKNQKLVYLKTKIGSNGELRVPF